jgi:twitching motility protein PilT
VDDLRSVGSVGEISLPIVSGVLGSGSGWLEDEPEVSGWVEASGSGLVGSGSKYHDYFDDDSVEDPFAGFVLDEILGDAIDVGASDVHITPEQEVRFTILGEISNRGYRVPSGDLTQRVMQSILSNVVESVFVQELEVDTSYVIRSGKYRGRRLRVSVGKTFGDVFLVFRVISDVVPSPEELGVSRELLRWTELPNGLVMLNGPTGTGKALRVDTPVLTPNGYVPLGDVRVGDELLDGRLDVCRVTWVSPLDANPRLWEVRLGDGQVIYADGNHKWFVGVEGESERVLAGRRESCKRVSVGLRAVGALLVDGVSFSLDELYSWVSAFGGRDEIAGSWGVFMALRYWDCWSDGSGKYDGRVSFGALAGWFEDRWSTVGGFVLMTTDEIVFGGVGDRCKFFLPRAGSGEFVEVVSVSAVEVGSVEYGVTRCLSVDSPDESFVCGNGVMTHNSTTLASLVKRIQLTRHQKIITLERPVEFIFGSAFNSLVTQREIGRDARQFSTALDSAMRQAPDIIMVGEVRNKIEVNELLRAAETGHLTISTMHTNSAAATLNRIKSLYEGDDQLRVLASLSDVARGFANQVLLPTVDGQSRFAVWEVLTVTEAVAQLILAGDVKGIRDYQMSRGITMEHALVAAVEAGKCTPEAAFRKSASPHLFLQLAEEAGFIVR